MNRVWQSFTKPQTEVWSKPDTIIILTAQVMNWLYTLRSVEIYDSPDRNQKLTCFVIHTKPIQVANKAIISTEVEGRDYWTRYENSTQLTVQVSRDHTLKKQHSHGNRSVATST